MPFAKTNIIIKTLDIRCTMHLTFRVFFHTSADLLPYFAAVTDVM